MHRLDLSDPNFGFQLGPRVAGSPASRATAEALAEAFSTAGVGVHTEALSYLGWSDVRSELSVGGGEYRCRPATWTLPTGAAGIRGRLCSLGTVTILAGLFEAPAFAVLDGDEELARIYVNPYRAPAAVLPTGRGPSLTGCAVWVCTDDGAALATLEGADVVLRVGDGIGPLHDLNVIAEIGGESDEVVIACAHYDAAAGAPGVIDNGAGIAWLGRLLSEAAGGGRPRRTLRVCAFAAEEIGLIGARHHAQRAVLAGTRIAAVVNVDAIGASPALDLQATPELDGLITQLSAPLDERHEVTRRRPGPGSDHMAFHEQGVPVIALLGAPSYPTYHQVQETLDAIDRERFDLAARVATEITLSLIGAGA